MTTHHWGVLALLAAIIVCVAGGDIYTIRLAGARKECTKGKTEFLAFSNSACSTAGPSMKLSTHSTKRWNITYEGVSTDKKPLVSLKAYGGGTTLRCSGYLSPYATSTTASTTCKDNRSKLTTTKYNKWKLSLISGKINTFALTANRGTNCAKYLSATSPSLCPKSTSANKTLLYPAAQSGGRSQWVLVLDGTTKDITPTFYSHKATTGGVQVTMKDASKGEKPKSYKVTIKRSCKTGESGCNPSTVVTQKTATASTSSKYTTLTVTGLSSGKSYILSARGVKKIGTYTPAINLKFVASSTATQPTAPVYYPPTTSPPPSPSGPSGPSGPSPPSGSPGTISHPDYDYNRYDDYGDDEHYYNDWGGNPNE